MLAAFLLIVALLIALFVFGGAGVVVAERMQKRGTVSNAEMPFFWLFGSGGVVLVALLHRHFFGR